VIDLSGRAALVTGASRGVGRATALLLAAAGADVALACHTRIGDAEATADAVRRSGRRATVLAGDLADSAVAARIASDAARAFGGLDIVVANSGTWPLADEPAVTVSDTRWRSTLSANLDATFFTVRATLPHLRPGGAVVLVASTAGQRGEAGHADYAASKGAIIAFTKSLAIECAPEIRVNCVAPGWVDTEMVAPVLREGGRERIESGIPLGRIASADDVAGPIVFLCSSLARHLTGEILNVNGGSVLCG